MVWNYRVRQVCIIASAITTLYLLINGVKISTNDNGVEGLRETLAGDITVHVSGQDDGSEREGTENKAVSLLKDQSCRIPKLDINGSEVVKFFTAAKPLPCSENEKNWVFIDEKGLIQMIPDKKGALCKIGYIRRKNDNENEGIQTEELVFGQRMKHDFAKVFCFKDRVQWEGLLFSAAEIPEARNRTQRNHDGKERLNVFILGFDSLSQMSFRRNLPKTVEFLEKTMKAVVLNGYNIVGDGTPQAFIPILTAKTEEELPLTRKRYEEANFVDDVYPFIWKNFSDLGYVTAYGEDAFRIGTFTYRLKGFRSQPTDHFTRTFFKENEGKPRPQWNCLGSEPLHKSWFRYSREFMRTYSDLPRFLLMHQSLLSHDDINLVKVEDDDLSTHLKIMYNAGDFENTLVILMADHGHRFAQLRSTHQGQLEERLPFFSFALPKKFRQTAIGAKIYENLKKNKDRLTTPFDIHATLMDLLHLPSLEELSVPQYPKRSLSLFRPIPMDRTCHQADVAPHWCTCLNWQDALSSDVDRMISNRLAAVVVNTINDQLKNVKNLCAELKLKELISANKLIPNDGLLKYRNVKDADGFVPDLSGSATASFAHYQLKLSTTPGKAIYEVTLFYDYRNNSVDLDLTSLSHVNKFGDDPHCIIDKNYFLATYCVCHDRV